MINSSTNSSNCEGVKLVVLGTVQGVGFRPFVYNLASRLDISGQVSNTSEGVIIHASGSDERLFAFREALENEAPPLARILSIEESPLSSSVLESIERGVFEIVFSKSSGGASATIPPDISICNDCYKELSDPTDRRFGYPFTNCTNCGPRFTIVETIPYDRPKTSMKVFPMCETCKNEYSDPANRRFHAQPNACPVCGPKISWHNSDGDIIESNAPAKEAVTALIDNKVIGIRGLGGFHLATNAYSKEAIDLLRKRKGRPAKPLAIMVPNLAIAKKFAVISQEEADQLISPEHPIVLLKKKENALATNLAPDVGDIGIMLPYTPLHHLLFEQDDCPAALVMTSGNLSGIPICTENKDGVRRLGHIVDGFLLHNREIVTRVDDSVVKLVTNTPRIFRRSRGYVPAPVVLPYELPEILACGGGLKSTFCLGRGNTAFLSQHIGDLFNVESFDFFCESIDHLKRVFELSPIAVACDMHPDFMSTHYAKELGLPLYPVQHHHAHAVSVMAENDLHEPVLAIVLDGTGYGADGTSWGGELLISELTKYTRLGHLSHLALPGGDIAATEPWRMAFSAIYSTFGDKELSTKTLPQSFLAIDEIKRKAVTTMLVNDFNTPKTSSCGRLFDAIASLVGVQNFSTYEGQAAIEFETLAWQAVDKHWKEQLTEVLTTENNSWCHNNEGKYEISSQEFVKVILASVRKGISPQQIALDFHFMLIEKFTNLTRHLSQQLGIKKVVLSGGCLQNSLLLEGFTHALSVSGLEPYSAREVPPNDGGISLGQAIIGGLSHVYRTSNEGHKS